MEKTYEQLQNELDTKSLIEGERRVSDDRYAIKLVEKAVIGVITLILIAVVAAILHTIHL